MVTPARLGLRERARGARRSPLHPPPPPVPGPPPLRRREEPDSKRIPTLLVRERALASPLSLSGRRSMPFLAGASTPSPEPGDPSGPASGPRVSRPALGTFRAALDCRGVPVRASPFSGRMSGGRVSGGRGPRCQNLPTEEDDRLRPAASAAQDSGSVGSPPVALPAFSALRARSAAASL